MLPDYVSQIAQPLEVADEWLLEAELQRLGIPMIGGHALPLEPEHAARVLVKALKASRPSIHATADSFVPTFESALIQAFDRGREVIQAMSDKSADVIAMRAGDVISDLLEQSLPKAVLAATIAGGKTGVKLLEQPLRAAAAKDAKLTMAFDVANPAVIEWARQHAAELVKDISSSVRKRIRIAVTELQEDGDFDFAHDRIMAAVGDEARADLIARHETILAAGKGQRLAWDQAEEEGLLSGKERREWIVTPDDRLCPICDALDGKTAKLNGNYPGGYEGPPAHVQCRCTEGIIG